MGVSPWKFITESFMAGDEKIEYIPLLKVKRIKDTVQVLDTSPTKVSNSTLTWTAKAMKPLEPFINSSLKKGKLDEIVIGTNVYSDNMGDASYFPEAKKIYFPLSFQETDINPEIIQNTLGHELGHALLEGINETPDDPQTFGAACNAIQKIAAHDLEDNFYDLQSLLESLQTEDPHDTRIYQTIITAAQNGTLFDLFPPPRDEYDKCAFPSMTALMGSARERLHISRGANSKETLDLLMKLNDTQSDLLRNVSIYSTFTDETYTKEKLSGHPQDYLQEKVASMFMLTVNYPKEFGINVFYLDDEKKTAVLNMHKKIMNDLKEDPEIAAALEPYLKDFYNAAGGSTTY